MLQRIDKIVSSQLNISRNDTRTLVKKGAVLCDGAVVTDVGTKCDAEKSEITVNGKPLFFKEHIYYDEQASGCCECYNRQQNKDGY